MRILLADADSAMSALIEFAVHYAGHVSYRAEDSAAALLALAREAPDLVLIDVSMQAFDGMELCREIRRRTTAPILAIGARNHEDDLVNAIDAGADDFICKPFSPRVLLARLRALSRRSGADDVNQVRAGHIHLRLDDRTLRIGSLAPIRLTPLETATCKLLLGAPGRTVSTAKLLAQLWGGTSARHQRMLKQLIYRLRQKIESDPSEPRLIVTIPAAGYKLIAD